MKKSTLILVLLAAIIGGLTWYFEFKHPPKEQTTAETQKPAFTFKAADIASIEIEKDGQTTKVERRGDLWQITSPVDTRADKFALNGIAEGVAAATIVQKFSAQPAQLSNFGLDKPAVTIVVHLKDGSKHELKLGSKNFDNTDVYALVDGAPDVYLFTSSLLTSADRDLDTLRDKSILNVESPNVVALDLKSSNGEFVLSRDGNNWDLKKPMETAADSTQVMGMLSQLSTSKMNSIVSETPDNLQKYGLNNPAVTVTAVGKDGGTQTLKVGKASGDNYYAMDASRPMVFEITGDLFKKLDVGLPDLRSKNLVHLTENDITQVEVRNANQTLDVSKQGDKWTITQPKAQAGKEAMPWKFLTPILQARATEILDNPPANISSKLAQPAVDVTLTDKSGKKLKVSISQPDGNDVYAKTDAGATIYKLPKQTLDDMNFQAADVVMSEGK